MQIARCKLKWSTLFFVLLLFDMVAVHAATTVSTGQSITIASGTVNQYYAFNGKTYIFAYAYAGYYFSYRTPDGDYGLSITSPGIYFVSDTSSSVAAQKISVSSVSATSITFSFLDPPVTALAGTTLTLAGGSTINYIFGGKIYELSYSYPKFTWKSASGTYTYTAEPGDFMISYWDDTRPPQYAEQRIQVASADSASMRFWFTACAPKTCTSLGKTCGSWSDGCGNVLNCGGACCTPVTCTSLGKTCGSWSDGCGGTLTCGGACQSPTSVNAGQSIPLPKFTDTQYLFNGKTYELRYMGLSSGGHPFFTYKSSAGGPTVTLQTTPPPSITIKISDISSTAMAQEIEITAADANSMTFKFISCAPKTCSSLGYSCGSWSDGCGGTLSCGSCNSQTCSNGKCTSIINICVTNTWYTQTAKVPVAGARILLNSSSGYHASIYGMRTNEAGCAQFDTSIGNYNSVVMYSPPLTGTVSYAWSSPYDNSGGSGSIDVSKSVPEFWIYVGSPPPIPQPQPLDSAGSVNYGGTVDGTFSGLPVKFMFFGIVELANTQRVTFSPPPGPGLFVEVYEPKANRMSPWLSIGESTTLSNGIVLKVAGIGPGPANMVFYDGGGAGPGFCNYQSGGSVCMKRYETNASIMDYTLSVPDESGPLIGYANASPDRASQGGFIDFTAQVSDASGISVAFTPTVCPASDPECFGKSTRFCEMGATSMGNYKCTHNTVNNPPGSYEYVISAKDSFGNLAVSPVNTFNVLDSSCAVTDRASCEGSSACHWCGGSSSRCEPIETNFTCQSDSSCGSISDTCASNGWKDYNGNGIWDSASKLCVFCTSCNSPAPVERGRDSAWSAHCDYFNSTYSNQKAVALNSNLSIEKIFNAASGITTAHISLPAEQRLRVVSWIISVDAGKRGCLEDICRLDSVVFCKNAGGRYYAKFRPQIVRDNYALDLSYSPKAGCQDSDYMVGTVKYRVVRE